MGSDLNPRGFPHPDYRGRNLPKLSPSNLATYPRRWPAATDGFLNPGNPSIFQQTSRRPKIALCLANQWGNTASGQRVSWGATSVSERRCPIWGCHYIECREEFRRSLCYGIFHKGLSTYYVSRQRGDGEGV